jgi:diaminohydroxyphosphoribosylaminopyrimidine deaminase/5-amino-6-(5-phosphoribosylamino)uracil reductase
MSPPLEPADVPAPTRVPRPRAATGPATNRDGAGIGRDGRTLDASEAWDRLLGVRTVRGAEAAGLVRHADGGWRWERDASPGATRLADLYLPLCLAGTRCAWAQLGQSLDGFIAARTGDAIYVTGDEDRRHLHRLRALADAVVVGAGTAIADDPRLTVRDCAGANPVRVVLDHAGRVPPHSRLFTDDAAPTLRVVGPDRDVPEQDGVEILRLPRSGAGFDPRSLLDALARRGLGRVLVEGGGVTVSRFLRERTLHRLYLTVAPVLIGDGVPGLRFPGTPRMRDALRAPTRRTDLGEDTLFEIDLGTVGAWPVDPADDQDPEAGQARHEGAHPVHHGNGESLGCA